MTNAQVAARLRRLGILLELDQQPRSRSRALRVAADLLDALEAPLELATLDALEIADDARDILREQLTLGAITLYEELSLNYPEGLVDIVEVPGIGVNKAINLREQLGVGSLDALIEAGEAGRLPEVKGIGAKSAAQILQAARELRAAHAALATEEPAPEEPAPEEPAPEELMDIIAEFMQEERARDALLEELEGAVALAETPAAPRGDAAQRAAQLILELGEEEEPALAVEVASTPEPEPEPAPTPEPDLEAAPAGAPEAPQLRCPACRHDGMERDGASVQCPRCGRRLLFEDNILDMVGYRAQGRVTLFQRLMEFPPYAAIYERISRPAFTMALARRGASAEIASAMAALAPRRGEWILDVACGTGNFSRAIAERMEDDPGSRVIGVDLSWPMLRQAEAMARRGGLDPLSFVRGDATRLPWADGTFDAVHCAAALHLFTAPDQALAEMARVLKPGGRVVVGTFVKSRNLLLRVPEAVTGRVAGMTWFTVHDLSQRLHAAGFSQVEHRTHGQAITLKALRRSS